MNREKRKQVSTMHRHHDRFSRRPTQVMIAVTVAATLSSLLAPAALGEGTAQPPIPIAGAARTISMDESGSLRLTGRHGFTLNEQGRASGTVTGTIYVHLKIVSSKRVTAEVNIYPRGGSISGYGTAGYSRQGAMGHFSGSLSINRGTGTYRNAHGSGLSFSGTIRRSDYAITVSVRGNVTD
jgi:hypothetical protein